MVQVVAGNNDDFPNFSDSTWETPSPWQNVPIPNLLAKLNLQVCFRRTLWGRVRRDFGFASFVYSVISNLIKSFRQMVNQHRTHEISYCTLKRRSEHLSNCMDWPTHPHTHQPTCQSSCHFNYQLTAGSWKKKKKTHAQCLKMNTSTTRFSQKEKDAMQCF